MDVLRDLKEYMATHELNQRQMADLLEVSEATISRWFSEERGSCTRQIMRRIADLLWGDMLSD